MGMAELWGAQPVPLRGHSAMLPSQPQPGPMPTCWELFWITTRELPVPSCQLAPLHGKQLLSPHVLAQQQAVLVLLPSTTLGWKLWPSEGFPGGEASPLQRWDLGQAGNSSSWPAALLHCHAQHFVFLPPANTTQMKDG